MTNKELAKRLRDYMPGLKPDTAFEITELVLTAMLEHTEATEPKAFQSIADLRGAREIIDLQMLDEAYPNGPSKYLVPALKPRKKAKAKKGAG